MNVRKFTNTLKSPSGRMVLFVGGIVVALALIGYFTGGNGREKGPAGPERALTAKVGPSIETTSYTESRPFSPSPAGPVPDANRRTAEPQSEPETPDKNSRHTDQVLGIQVYAEAIPVNLPAQGQVAPPVQTINLNEAYAESGRMLWCHLSFAVETSSFETPIIGTVTQDLWWGGKLIIPKDTQVLGKARHDRDDDRIGAFPQWTLVIPPFENLPRGGSLVINAIVTDHIFSEIKKDGRPGLHGKVFSATSTADEIKFFAANLMVGAMNGLTPQQQTVYGSQIIPGAKSALFQAAGNSAERYADRIFETIRKEGFYVSVPPGKEFYLYVDQPLLLREAKIGSTLAFQPTAVGENEMRRAGFLPEPRKQQAEPEPLKPEDVLPAPQLPVPPSLPPPSYLPPELDSSKLQTTKNPTNK